MTTNYAYDIQAEGDRSYYAVRIFKLSSNKKRIVQQFKDYLINLPDDLHWGHKDHTINVAIRLAKLDYLRIDEVVEIIDQHIDKEESIAAELYLKLRKPGVRRFISVVADRHRTDADDIYYPYEERNKKILNKIHKYGIKTKDLKEHEREFIDYLKNWKREEIPRKHRFESFDQYIEYIKLNELRGRHIKFYETFTAQQIIRLHEELEDAKDDNLIIGLLKPLNTHVYTGSIDRLIQLLDARNVRVRGEASKMLAKIKDPEVRKSAINKVEGGMDLRNSIVALSSNLKKSDDGKILNTIQKIDDLDELHNVGYGLMEADNISNSSDLSRSLKYIFYHSTCGICRMTLLYDHIDVKALPKVERRSLKYDSNKEIRDFTRM